MIFLSLSIFVSVLFGISFKIIAIKHINSFQTIVVNYIVAGSLGFLTTSSHVTPINAFEQSWFYVALGLGIIFIGSLFVIAETTAKLGISVAQVANRMAVVIPITVAILFYGDSITPFKIIGIVLAIIAVYLVSHKQSTGVIQQKKGWLFPLIIFLCGGIIDTTINYAQRHLLSDTDFDAFLSTIFSTAFLFGLLVLVYQIIIKKEQFQLKAIPSGIVLGIINYGTMFFIIKALNSKILEASTLFPINNLSILTLSTFVSVIIFKEKLSKKNWLGIALSLTSIIILGIMPLISPLK